MVTVCGLALVLVTMIATTSCVVAVSDVLEVGTTCQAGVKAVPPQVLLVNRMMVDTVVEAPNGAHFTTAEPDYRRDEKFQRHYAEAAASDETWQQFVATYLSGGEADYQAAVRKFQDAHARSAGEEAQ